MYVLSFAAPMNSVLILSRPTPNQGAILFTPLNVLLANTLVVIVSICHTPVTEC